MVSKMPEKKKLKLKKFFFHPITMFLVGTILVMLISLILSSFEMQSTYNSITTNGKDLTSKLVVVENLFNYENLKSVSYTHLTLPTNSLV